MRVGLPVTETLFDERYFSVGQQPLVPVQFCDPRGNYGINVGLRADFQNQSPVMMWRRTRARLSIEIRRAKLGGLMYMWTHDRQGL